MRWKSQACVRVCMCAYVCAPASVLAGVPQCEFHGSSALYLVTAVVCVRLLSLSGPLCESGRVPELQMDTDAQCSKHSAGLEVAE